MKPSVWLLLFGLLCGCDQPAEQSYAGLGQQAGAFRQVTRGHRLAFPRDHGAHDGFRIEWWYVTANLQDARQRDWGAQWTLFRSALTCGWATRR